MNFAEVDENMEVHAEAAFEGCDAYDVLGDKFCILGLRGAKERTFSRFTRAENAVLDTVAEGVRMNGRAPSGAQVRFVTDSRRIGVSVKLSYHYNMDNLSAIAQCGTDLYFRDAGASKSAYKLGGVSRIAYESDHYSCELVKFPSKKRREIILHLPLYMEVVSCSVSVDRGSFIAADDALTKLPKILFYGTSILQGASASRSGVCHTNLLSRRLGRECVNFGFSGAGNGEPEVIDIIAKEENVGAVIVDYEPNAGHHGTLHATLMPMLRRFREVYPQARIILVSATFNALDNSIPAWTKRRKTDGAFQRDAVEQLRADGDKNIYYLDGFKVLGADREDATIDGCHLNDLGCQKLARALEKLLRE